MAKLRLRDPYRARSTSTPRSLTKAFLPHRPVRTLTGRRFSSARGEPAAFVLSEPAPVSESLNVGHEPGDDTISVPPNRCPDLPPKRRPAIRQPALFFV